MDNWYLLTVKQMPFLVVTKHNNGACTEYFFLSPEDNFR